MYKGFLFIIFISFLHNITAQTIDDWQNPAVVGINKEAPHATLIPYPDERFAMEDKRASSSYIKVLNGYWKFKFVERPADKPNGFEMPSYDDKNWDDIAVPSNWELQGYGVPDLCEHPL